MKQSVSPRNLSEKDLIERCQEFHAKYEIPKNPPTVFNRKFYAALGDVLSFCQSEDVDPVLFLEAQYAELAWFLKEKGMSLYANMLTSSTAPERYSRFLHHVQEHSLTRTIKDTNTRDPHTNFDAEMALLRGLLDMSLLGYTVDAPLIEATQESVARNYPDWECGADVIARRQAMSTVLDQKISTLSDQVSIGESCSVEDFLDFYARTVE